MKFQDLAGQQIGGWEVLHRDSESMTPTRWVCKCRCGYTQSILADSLSRHTSSGCMQCAAKRRCKGEWTGLVLMWHRLKSHAKRRGIAFAVEKQELLDLLIQQDHKCALSGEPINIATSRLGLEKGYSTASLDRKNSDGDYVISNVQWVHKEVNRLKNDFTEERLFRWCQLIATHMTEKAGTAA